MVAVLDETNGWQRRSAGSRGPSSGVLETQRKTIGCELASDYAIIGRSEVPGPLRELGERLARFCAQHEWPYSHTAIGGGSDGAAQHTMGFDQVYIQRYVPGTVSETLGFHFDSFSQFGELICGVTLSGSCDFLLRKTKADNFVKDVPRVLQAPNTLAIRQAPLCFYAMTGIVSPGCRACVRACCARVWPRTLA